MPDASAKTSSGQHGEFGQNVTAEQSLSDRTIVLLCVAASTATLVIDLSIPLGVAVGVPYIVPVLFSLWSRRRSITLGAAIAGTLLTIVGFIASPSGGELWKVIANRLLAIFAIWITTTLCLWQKRQKQRSTNLYVRNELLVNERRQMAESLELVSRQKAELTGTNANLKKSRASALNMMRDAEAARQKAEEMRTALSDREAFIRAIVDSAMDGIITIDDQGIIISFNPAAERLFGYTSDQTIGRNISMLMPPPFRDEHDEHIRRYLRTGVTTVIGIQREVVAQNKDGSLLPIELSVSELLHADRRMFMGIVRDISERKEAQAELKKLSRAVEQSPASVVITDVTGTIEYVNPSFTRLTGYTSQEVIGKTPGILNSGKVPRETIKQLWETILSGEVWRGELLNRKKNGELYWEFASISPITEDDGQITHFVAVKENITERKQAEEELARLNQELVDTSRQAGMAEVASGVLHNVGNVLNSVTTSAGEVARRVKALPVDDLNSVAQLVKQQGDRTAEFFANDERGAMIPDFLVQVGSLLTDEQEAVTWTTNLPIDAYC